MNPGKYVVYHIHVPTFGEHFLDRYSIDQFRSLLATDLNEFQSGFLGYQEGFSSLAHTLIPSAFSRALKIRQITQDRTDQEFGLAAMDRFSSEQLSNGYQLGILAYQSVQEETGPICVVRAQYLDLPGRVREWQTTNVIDLELGE